MSSKERKHPPLELGPGEARMGQVSRESGATRRQLQYWNKTGLLQASRVSAGGHNVYNAEDRMIVEIVIALAQCGVSRQSMYPVVDAVRQRVKDHCAEDKTI